MSDQKWQAWLFGLISLGVIVHSSKPLWERYKRVQAEREAAGAPKSFWAAMRGQGFYQDEDGNWHNG